MTSGYYRQEDNANGEGKVEIRLECKTLRCSLISDVQSPLAPMIVPAMTAKPKILSNVVSAVLSCKRNDTKAELYIKEVTVPLIASCACLTS